MEAFLTKKGVKLKKVKQPKKSKGAGKGEDKDKRVCWDCGQPGHIRGDPKCPGPEEGSGKVASKERSGEEGLMDSLRAAFFE